MVGVLINSGSVEDANAWVPYFEPEYSIWVTTDDSLGDRLGSRLVPTYLLVDAAGKVRKKLVGFKEQGSVMADLAVIRGSSAASRRRADDPPSRSFNLAQFFGNEK